MKRQELTPALQEAADKKLDWAISVDLDFDGYLEAVNDGADVNAISKTDHRPLIYAAILNELPAVVKDMVGRGANVNATVEDGWTALHEAASYGDAEIVQCLVDAGASISAFCSKPNCEGGYPIHRASGGAIALLAELGADLCARDPMGLTPLHYKTKKQDPEAIRLLLAAGAEPYPLDNEGKSPLDYLDTNSIDYEEVSEALAPVFAERDRQSLQASTAPFVECERPIGQCGRCGRPAHTGRCRL